MEKSERSSSVRAFDLNNYTPEISDVSRLGTTRLVSFIARRVRKRKVVYLNTRWFLAHDVDITAGTVRADVETWLIDNFGVSVPDFSREHETDYEDTEVIMYADRYGGTGGGVHGGSGRSGIRGKFNAKGIGRTPLVSSHGDWYHSHGCMWLEECVREAICSEVLDRESPIGTQPIISIIDLGMHIRRSDGSLGERRGVIVRPNIFRLGHFQRSIFFGTSGSKDSDQYLDAENVAEAAKNIFGCRGDRQPHSLLTSLLRTAEQIAFCRFHRLWTGPFCSPNVGLNGEAMDFGAFRAVPSWRRFRGEAGAATFGEEEAGIFGAFVEIAKTVERAGGELITIQRIQDAMESRIKRVFDRECAAAINLQEPHSVSIERKIIDKLKDIYKWDQRIFDSPEKYYDRLEDANVEEVSIDKGSRIGAWVREVEDDIRAAYEGNPQFAVSKRVSLSTFRRYFSPRPLLERERLLARSLRLLHSRHFSSLNGAGLIKRFIEQIVSRSRRIWPGIPKHLIITSQGGCNGVAIAYCLNGNTGERFAWIEAPHVSNMVWIGRFINLEDLDVRNVSMSSSTCRILLPLALDGIARNISSNIELPPANYFYQDG